MWCGLKAFFNQTKNFHQFHLDHSGQYGLVFASTPERNEVLFLCYPRRRRLNTQKERKKANIPKSPSRYLTNGASGAIFVLNCVLTEYLQQMRMVFR